MRAREELAAAAVPDQAAAGSEHQAVDERQAADPQIERTSASWLLSRSLLLLLVVVFLVWSGVFTLG